MIMKKLILMAAAATMFACAPKNTITVENPLDIDRSAELVEIPVEQLSAVALAEGQTYVVSVRGRVVPSQVTHDGLLLFQSGLGAGEKAKFTVKAGEPHEFETVTGGGFAPERQDDFIAAPYVRRKLLRNDNFINHEMLDNGPLRTTVRLIYPPFEIDGSPVGERRTVSTDAGSQLSRVVHEWGVSRRIIAAVGFPLRNPEVGYRSEGNVLMVEEPDTEKASGVLLGAVLTRTPTRVTTDEYEVASGESGAGVHRHVLAMVPYTPGTPLTYYTGFGREEQGDWTADSFAAYLNDFSAGLKTPLVVTVE